MTITEPIAGPEPVPELVRRVRAFAERAAVRPRLPEPERKVAPPEEMAAVRTRRFVRECWPRFQGAILTGIGDEDAWSGVLGWAENPAGRNLVITGPVGAGKSWAAVAATRARAEAGASVMLYTVAMLLDRLRPGGADGALEEAIAADVLLLDDLGSERPTDWTAERLSIVIDQRWLHERPIVTTTNLTLGPAGSLVEAIGERAYSRLVHSGAVVHRIDGPNRRKGAGQ